MKRRSSNRQNYHSFIILKIWVLKRNWYSRRQRIIHWRSYVQICHSKLHLNNFSAISMQWSVLQILSSRILLLLNKSILINLEPLPFWLLLQEGLKISLEVIPNLLTFRVAQYLKLRNLRHSLSRNILTKQIISKMLDKTIKYIWVAFLWLSEIMK